MRVHRMGPMIQQVQSPCGDCRGEGEMWSAKDKCRTCNGRKVDKGRKSDQKEEKVFILIFQRRKSSKFTSKKAWSTARRSASEAKPTRNLESKLETLSLSSALLIMMCSKEKVFPSRCFRIYAVFRQQSFDENENRTQRSADWIHQRSYDTRQ